MEAAGKAGVPAVVAPGCLDMANFGERETVPAGFEGRNLYIHNPQVTLMRTNAEECAQLGKILAEKVNALGLKRVQLGLTPHRDDPGTWEGVQEVLAEP